MNRRLAMVISRQHCAEVSRSASQKQSAHPSQQLRKTISRKRCSGLIENKLDQSLIASRRAFCSNLRIEARRFAGIAAPIVRSEKITTQTKNQISMIKPLNSRRLTCLLVGLALLPLATFKAQAQIDPAPRQILHAGVNAPVASQGPMGAYLFYYWNMANVPTTNTFLRLAIAPVYVDGEMGFKGLLGENTDLAVGANGGLYAESYQEVDGGNWKKDQSFNGNAAGLSSSIYHRFNPDQQIPLTGVLRGSANYEMFDATDNTGEKPGNHFKLPDNQTFYTLRTGFRWGGKEPYLAPTLGMEVSGWYECEYRPNSGAYGYPVGGTYDHTLESVVHRFFGRAQINYTTLDSKNYIVAGIQGGTSINADRLGGYRLGGVLPYTKEFPLTIPGYFYQEISADTFGLLYGTYAIPFGAEKRWYFINMAALAVVKYIDGTGQSGAVNSGVGTGLGYISESKRWKILSIFGYGINAKRGDDRGGFSLGCAFQYNFGATKTAADEAYQQLENEYGDNAHGMTK
jgi:hypothetical protein